MWFLALLLTATGIGSFLWHGTRNESFLAFDAIPGLFFLLVAVYAWLRRFYRWWSAGLLFLAFIGIEALVIYFSAALRINSLFIGLTPGIVLAGAWLVARTYQETVRAAALGGGALLLALFALFFRTIDLSVCASFPLGTHFLWHILLSVGALLLILTLIVIDYTRAKRLNRNIMLDT
jgi:hypothetical protein